ncbi:acyl-CoA dehydrogenase family protein [Mycobacteroides abscessus]|uniref:acyl-CoA dehydrogenase family protein n=1 Tax=Mycobacteroides abscessus TaxID=36809 RepID=UPI00092784A3|nr:acyl-CoA dehydrogenase family protein [Mycobacteroides abscessus]MDO3333910.1 acyl-CoA/acyl-ACP dehydrogenase [Mycobacteroides abscessus subsp. bolletii]QSM86878.1 acyl-CoA/acyl-ACP dehydrogenase [Mycobacteroides abscessus subsp. bolletii]SIB89622.1 acyl-CoA dehydrogenase [Mycobacteroides abscessus subsp. bolletii]SKS88054.1 acyl-CoA dehydrogenase [Mycobacteroides abscessus subsp. bolletii]SKT11169.1 acyl-CoA dehydrogenase [Mycobacteroides abscessus subsp. bolletii]
MRIGPDSDQLELRDSMRNILAKSCPPTLVRACYDNPRGWQELWTIATELQWTSLACRGLPTAGADIGLTTLDLVLALEVCGQALAPIPFVSSIGMAAGAARCAGSALTELIDEIVCGAVVVLAVQPVGQRLPGVPMRSMGGRIQGSAICVPDAVHAEVVLTLVSDGDATSLVALRGNEFSVIPDESADPSRPLATVEVDTPRRPVPLVDVESVLAPALLAVSSELVGVAQGALQLAVPHACSRTQFGAPIGSYQGIKHALADVHVGIERARSLNYHAAATLDDPQSASAERFLACALAKAAAGEAAVTASRTMIQVLGALGQTWEHDAHLYLRRAWVGAALLGDSSSLYHLVGKRYLERAAS